MSCFKLTAQNLMDLPQGCGTSTPGPAPSQNHVVYHFIFPWLSIPHGNDELWIISKASARGS